MHFLDARGPQDMRVYAIGDVHGRLDLLAAMHAEIERDLERLGRERGQAKDWRIVHLGDYVDRGTQSKGVIDFLVAAVERDARNVVLAGNHDVGLLDFLASPDPDGVFMRHGGVQTAQSYGVDLTGGDPRRGASDGRGLAAAHAALVAAVPRAHVAFLSALPFSASFGDFFFCHAGIRPGIPLERQDPLDLTWIRHAFLDHPGLHDKVIVHGHTPVAEPVVMANRVNVDTYAWHSGRLTALVVDGARKRLMAVSADGAVQFSDAVTP